MTKRNYSFRLSDEELGLLKAIDPDNTSNALRQLLTSGTAVVQTETPVPGFNSGPNGDEEGMGRVYVNAAPESKAMRELELFMASQQAGIQLDVAVAADEPQIGKHILTAAARRAERAPVVKTGEQAPVTLDAGVLAMMQLAEYYTVTEGDLWQTILVPLEVGFQDFDFPTGTKDDVAEARAYLEGLSMRDRIEEIFLGTNTYGNCYPLTVEEGKEITEIVVPNPKHIAIARQSGFGPRIPFYTPGSEDILKSLRDLSPQPSFFTNVSGWEWNEAEVSTYGVPINPESIRHFHVPKHAHNVYGIPPLIRASRAIDTRRYLEEMTRSTIEGIRNQLWVFTLENPRRGEAKALQAQLAGSRGARTGYLVWGSNLKVQQFIPESIDALLANETFREKTLDVYRKLGITIRVVSGEAPGGTGTARSDSETDVQVYLNRLLYTRKPIQNYLQYLVDRHFGKPGVVTVRLADVELQIQSRIKNILTPLMGYGLPSPRTAFVMAGMDADREMEQHKRDKAFRDEYILPYSGFAQDGPTGRAEQSVRGRPPGKTEMAPRQKAAASQFDYSEAVKADWRLFLSNVHETGELLAQTEQAQVFILNLLALNAAHRRDAYEEGYYLAGGSGTPAADQITAVSLWDRENALRFQAEIVRRLEVGENLADLERRAELYATVGYRMAYAAGMMQARREQGYTHWKRVIHYSSASGPCALCREDSRTIHSIEEAFSDHPNGQCSQLWLMFFQRPDMPGVPFRLPDVRYWD